MTESVPNRMKRIVTALVGASVLVVGWLLLAKAIGIGWAAG